MTAVTTATLSQLGAGVARPGYDRGQVRTGIVHIGVGNFHRSHQAMYLDTLMNNAAAMDWGICGVGLQPSNPQSAMRWTPRTVCTPWSSGMAMAPGTRA